MTKHTRGISTLAIIIIVVVVAISAAAWQSHQRKSEAARIRAEQAAAQLQQAQAEQAAALQRERAARQKEEAQRKQEEARRIEAQQRQAAQQAHNQIIGDDIKRLANQMQKFNDLNNIAARTPRLTLSHPLQQLQQIMRETESIQVASCLAPSKKAAVDGMTAQINGYLTFMSERGSDPSPRSEAHFKQAVQHLETFLPRLNNCAPNARP